VSSFEAHGSWGPVEQTWPPAAIQRCTVHKLRNLLTTAPKRLHYELRADNLIPTHPDRLFHRDRSFRFILIIDSGAS
jgi:transposase-like protein